MKRKWLSCVLSAALLSSVLSVTPVSARGGVETSVSQADTAVVAGTADPAAADEAPAVEETAQVTALAAEEAAAPVAEIAAPAANAITTYAADESAAVSEDNKTVMWNGSQYDLTVLQDFTGFTTGDTKAVMNPGKTQGTFRTWGARTGSASIFEVEAEAGNMAYGFASNTSDLTAGWGAGLVGLYTVVNKDALDGDGIYFELKTDGTINTRNNQVFADLVAAPDPNNITGGVNANNWYQTPATTEPDCLTKGGNCVKTDDGYQVFVPYSLLLKSGTAFQKSAFSSAGTAVFGVAVARYALTATTWTYLYIDNICTYAAHTEPDENVHTTTTYTVRANSLRSTSDAMARNDLSDLYTISVKRGKASFTFKKEPTFTDGNAFDTYMYFPISGADLKKTSAITFTVKRPADMGMTSPSYFAALYDGITDTSGQLGQVTASRIGSYATDKSAEYGGNTQSFNIPISAFSPYDSTMVNASATYYLRISFNANANVTYTGQTLEVWDIGLSHESTGTFEAGTVTKTVAVSTKNGGTVTATVDGQDHARLMSASIEVAETTNIQLTAVAFADKKFNNWSKSDDNGFSDDSETITSSETTNVSYVAQFSDAFYTVTVKEKDGSTLFYETTVGYSDTITPIAPAYYEEGLMFQSWTISDSDKVTTVEENLTYEILGDVTFTPVYEAIASGHLTMVDIYVTNGTINNGSSNYMRVSYSTVVTLKATDQEDKVFSHWEQGGTIVGYEKTLTILAKVDATYEAVYVNSDAEKKTPESQLIVQSVKLSDATGTELTLICEWHIPSGTVADFDNVTLTVACTDGKYNQTYTCNVTAYNGYYTLRIAFPGGIPANFTATVTLTGAGDAVSKTFTYSAQ